MKLVLKQVRSLRLLSERLGADWDVTGSIGHYVVPDIFPGQSRNSKRHRAAVVQINAEGGLVVRAATWGHKPAANKEKGLAAIRSNSASQADGQRGVALFSFARFDQGPVLGYQDLGCGEYLLIPVLLSSSRFRTVHRAARKAEQCFSRERLPYAIPVEGIEQWLREGTLVDSLIFQEHQFPHVQVERRTPIAKKQRKKVACPASVTYNPLPGSF